MLHVSLYHRKTVLIYQATDKLNPLRNKTILNYESLKDGAYYNYHRERLLLRIRSAHLQILEFPIANAY